MSFFIIVWQMLINDLISVVFIQLILSIPITFTGQAIYPEWFTRYVATIDTVTYSGLIVFCYLITINRFLVFLWPRLNDFLFTKPRIYVYVFEKNSESLWLKIRKKGFR